MAKINIIYHQFPHYRRAVLRELVKGGRHEYRFFASHDDVFGIKPFQGDELVHIERLQFRLKGRLWMLRGYWSAVFDRSADALIILGNSNMPASWIAALVGRLLRKKVFFWAHGWLKPESVLKRRVRNIYFGLAHGVLVYGERAVLMAELSGFDTAKVHVIYNSLDYESAEAAIGRIESGKMKHFPLPQSFFTNRDRPVLICTARLTELCRFDLLLVAATRLRDWGSPVNILLVGDGPVKQFLEDQANELGVDVHFFGACYDEDVLANLIYHSDITVSPGKIGLTVIHSLTYGTPAITHGDLNEQMPEVEAIEDGSTGLLFVRNDADNLAEKIRVWLEMEVSREDVRRNCRNVIATKWNPASQRREIEAAIDELTELGATK